MNIERKAELFENVINYIAEWDDETAKTFLYSIGMKKKEIELIADGYYSKEKF